RLCARRCQEHQRASGHLTAELPAIRPELLDQLLVERLNVGRDLWRWSSLWRLICAHEFSKQLIGLDGGEAKPCDRLLCLDAGPALCVPTAGWTNGNCGRGGLSPRTTAYRRTATRCSLARRTGQDTTSRRCACSRPSLVFGTFLPGRTGRR